MLKSYHFKLCSLALLSLLLVAMPALAEEVFMYNDEFIVEPNNENLYSMNGQVDALSSQGLTTIRDIAGKAKLVRASLPTNQLSLSAADPVRKVTADDYRFCKDLVASGAAKACSPNFRVKISKVPNDELFDDQWGMNAAYGANVTGAWDYSTGSKSVVVAVVDTGIDYNHPDLSPNVWINGGEIPNNGKDDDGNGIVDDIYGINTYDTTGNPKDENGHGTHVAGIIGAAGNNSKGVAGVNWNVKIMGCRFMDEDGDGSIADAIDAIYYVINMKKRGVNIVAINSSWGGSGYSENLKNAIKEAGKEGILFVAAAGNESLNVDNNPIYPASFSLDNMISVAALSRNRSLADFSNFGTESVDIAAPGVAIVSTFPDNNYKSMSGTSMATPFVTGAAALICSKVSCSGAKALKTRLLNNASTDASLKKYVTGGRFLNVAAALNDSAEPVEEKVCTYGATQIYNAPSHVLNSDIISNVDELNFQKIQLGFTFPFYGTEYRNILISPNGVIYFGSSEAIDFNNTSEAPKNSIAVLHTDFIFPGSEHGIRVSGDSSHMTVTWHGRAYQFNQMGDITASATLYPNGEIITLYSFSTPGLAQNIGYHSTIGVRGFDSDSAYTYSYNNAKLSDGLSLVLTPQCTLQKKDPDDSGDEESLSVKTIQFVPYSKNGKSVVSKAIPNAGLNVSVLGSGSGNVPLKVKLGRYQCKKILNIRLQNGYYSKKIKTPKAIKNYKNIKLSSNNGKSKSVKVKNPNKNNRLLAKKIQKDCNGLIKKLAD